ncbi:MAG: hypothetical protein HOD92_16155 [Deltaproteobacteria bacterium]|jgi:hypothetical protein|nr:hypothetical protein [Deltaproteobacteria bacterium]
MDRFDSERIYCRKLGHELNFKYCRQEQDFLPCSKILNCWFERLAIKEYILQHFNEAEREKMLIPPQDKIVSLIDIIERAKLNSKNKNE